MADAMLDGTPLNAVGEKLRAAREEKGMNLEDVAAVTRIPTRHLQHIENGEWDALPAVTYSVGFARAYANAVGLNGAEVGAELRAQLGGSPSSAAAQSYYEPADPARMPPRRLVIAAALIALLLAAGYLLWRNGAVDDTVIDEAEVAAVDTPIVAPDPAASPRPAAAVPGPASATGPVVLTATDEVWVRIYEAGGGPVISERTLKAGDRIEVPATAKRPQIRAGRPDALKVTVGQTVIPPLGPAGRPIGDVSLLPVDLVARLHSPNPAQPVAAPAPAQPSPR